MKFGPQLLQLLSKTYEPSTMVETTFSCYDLTFKTDDKGRPVLLFIGKKDVKGKIKGERFARRLLNDDSGNIIKDYWDAKGKIH
jgi:hypothetical protein